MYYIYILLIFKGVKTYMIHTKKKYFFLSLNLLLSSNVLLSQQSKALRSSPNTDYEITLAKNADVYINADIEDFGILTFGNRRNGGIINIFSTEAININTFKPTGTSDDITILTDGNDNSGNILVKTASYEANSGNLQFSTSGNTSSGTVDIHSQTTTGDSGSIVIYSNTATGNSGAIDIHSETTTGNSGDLDIYSKTTTGNSGTVNIYSKCETIGNSGNLEFYSQTATGNSGDVYLTTVAFNGSGTSGDSGEILIQSLSSDANSGNLEFSTSGNTSSGAVDIHSQTTTGNSGTINIYSNTATGNSGAIDIHSQTTTGNSGTININSQTNTGDSGDLTFYTQSQGIGDSGNLYLGTTAVNAFGTSGDSGDILIQSLSSDANSGNLEFSTSGNTSSGTVDIHSETTTGNSGTINIYSNTATGNSGTIDIHSETTTGDSGDLDIYSKTTTGNSGDLTFYTQSQGIGDSGNLYLGTTAVNAFGTSGDSGEILIQSLSSDANSGNLEFSTSGNTSSGTINIYSETTTGESGALEFYSETSTGDSGAINIYTQSQGIGDSGNLYLGTTAGNDFGTSGNSGDILIQSLSSDANSGNIGFATFGQTSSGSISLYSNASEGNSGTLNFYTQSEGNGDSADIFLKTFATDDSGPSGNSGDILIQSQSKDANSGIIEISTTGNIAQDIILLSSGVQNSGNIIISSNSINATAGDLLIDSTSSYGNSGKIVIATSVTEGGTGTSGGIEMIAQSKEGYTKSIEILTHALSPHSDDYYQDYNVNRHGCIINRTGEGDTYQGGENYYNSPYYDNTANCIFVTDRSNLILPSRIPVVINNGIVQPPTLITKSWIRFPAMVSGEKMIFDNDCKKVYFRYADSQFNYKVSSQFDTLAITTQQDNFYLENIPSGAELSFQNEVLIYIDSELEAIDVTWNTTPTYAIGYTQHFTDTAVNLTTLDTYVRYTIPSMGSSVDINNTITWGDAIVINGEGYKVRLCKRGSQIIYHNNLTANSTVLTAECDHQEFLLNDQDFISTIGNTEVIFTHIDNKPKSLTVNYINANNPSVAPSNNYNLTIHGDSINNSIILAAKGISPIYSQDNSVILAGDQIIIDTSDLRLYNIKSPTGGETVYGLSINTNGQVFMSTGSTSSFSSRRFKDNIQSLKDSETEEIYDLNTYSFNYKNNQNVTEYGLIVEELVENNTLENAVRYDREGRPEAISYNTIMIAMLKEMQKLKKNYDRDMSDMKNHIYNLEDTVSQLQENIYYLQNIINEME